MAAAGGAGGAQRSVADATHDLYRQYGKQIYAYCLHQLRSREEAEDAVQTTFLNAFRGLQRGTTTRFEQAWLYKIAQNVCIARRSSSGRRLKLESPDDFEILQEVVPSGSRSGDGDTLELVGLDEALDSMPENQRRAILLREWQGLSYREIATELGVSQGAVEMLIFRARRTLATALEQPAGIEKKRRGTAKTGFSLGSLIAAMKSLLFGGAALKMAAVAVSAAVVGTNAVHTMGQRPLVRQSHPHRTPPAAPAAQAMAGTMPAARVTTTRHRTTRPRRGSTTVASGSVAPIPTGRSSFGRGPIPVVDAAPPPAPAAAETASAGTESAAPQVDASSQPSAPAAPATSQASSPPPPSGGPVEAPIAPVSSPPTSSGDGGGTGTTGRRGHNHGKGHSPRGDDTGDSSTPGNGGTTTTPNGPVATRYSTDTTTPAPTDTTTIDTATTTMDTTETTTTDATTTTETTTTVTTTTTATTSGGGDSSSADDGGHHHGGGDGNGNDNGNGNGDGGNGGGHGHHGH